METPDPDPNNTSEQRLLDAAKIDPESSHNSQPLVTSRNYIQSLPTETLDHIFTFSYWDATFDPLSEYLDAPGEIPELDASDEDSDDEPFPDHALTSEARQLRQARKPELMKSMETLQMESRAWLNDQATPFDRTLFPYALAEVCPEWKLILLQRPYYWTRVVLSIDNRNPTPLEDAEEIFRITAPRVLEVSIGHHDDPSDDDDPEAEKERVKAFIDLLLRHLSRCRKLTINVHSLASAPEKGWCDSLPRPSTVTISRIGKGASIFHCWRDEIPLRWSKLVNLV